MARFREVRVIFSPQSGGKRKPNYSKLKSEQSNPKKSSTKPKSKSKDVKSKVINHRLSKKKQLLDQVLSSLNQIKYAHFRNFQKNPMMENVIKGRKQYPLVPLNDVEPVLSSTHLVRKVPCTVKEVKRESAKNIYNLRNTPKAASPVDHGKKKKSSKAKTKVN